MMNEQILYSGCSRTNLAGAAVAIEALGQYSG